jgi:tetratricopeptide (TPR) repeat protein
MKQLLLIITFSALSLQFFGQYVNQFVETDLGALQNIMDRSQSKFDKNLAKIESLMDWIIELRQQTNEKEFLNAMNLKYNKLRSFLDKDISILSREILAVELGIKEDIEKYNLRLKEASNPEKYWKTANESYQRGEYRDAILNYNYVIQLSPEFAGAFLYRGLSFYNLGATDDAIEDYSTFIQMEPSEPLGYRSRGWAKYYKDDFLGALSDFNRMIELNPDAEAYYNRGSAKSGLKDYYGAINDYKKAIELYPQFSMAYNNLGWAKFEMKKYNEALIDVNKALELDGTNFVAYDSRAEIKFNLNDFNGCISDSDVALKLNPNIANAYFLKGRASYKLGVKQKACEFWSKAGELGKKEAYDYISKYCID